MWKEKEIKELKRLSRDKRPCEVAAMMGIGKNSVLGKLYRIKVKNGYVPPADSKHTAPRFRPRMTERKIIGKRKCNTCGNEFEFYSHYQRFCYHCKESINSHGYENYTI